MAGREELRTGRGRNAILRYHDEGEMNLLQLDSLLEEEKWVVVMHTLAAAVERNPHHTWDMLDGLQMKGL